MSLFERLKKSGLSVERNNYNFIYADSLEGECLEDLFMRFNLNHPKGFKGHSLSMSDIIVLKKGGKLTAHYIDIGGYRQVPEFEAGLYNLEPFITIKQTEHEQLQKGDILPLREANLLFEALDANQHKEWQNSEYKGKKYFKTDYTLHYLQGGEHYTHDGEQLLGRGDETLIASIRENADEQLMSPTVQAFWEAEGRAEQNNIYLQYLQRNLLPHLILHDEFSELNNTTDNMLASYQEAEDTAAIDYLKSVRKYTNDCRIALNTQESVSLPEFPLIQNILTSDEHTTIRCYKNHFSLLPRPVWDEELPERIKTDSEPEME